MSSLVETMKVYDATSGVTTLGPGVYREGYLTIDLNLTALHAASFREEASSSPTRLAGACHRGGTDPRHAGRGCGAMATDGNRGDSHRGTVPTMTTDSLVRDLLRPDAYPWRPVSVDLIETHISWVFLAGDRVVKVKRPVRLDFVDQSTPEARRAICEAEVHLNRRLTGRSSHLS